jgi:hypothetical protein
MELSGAKDGMRRLARLQQCDVHQYPRELMRGSMFCSRRIKLPSPVTTSFLCRIEVDVSSLETPSCCSPGRRQDSRKISLSGDYWNSEYFYSLGWAIGARTELTYRLSAKLPRNGKYPAAFRRISEAEMIIRFRKGMNRRSSG